MLFLIVVGLAAGVVTSISPCVLPVLPVILTAAAPGAPAGPGHPAEGRDPERAAAGAVTAVRRRSWRPYGIVLGLVVSFSLSILFGAWLLSALGLPAGLLRGAGIAVLVVAGLGLVWPPLGEVLERPFARLPGRRIGSESNGLVLGLGLGLVFVPCAGPVLSAIAVVGAAHRFGADTVALTAAFAVGAALPLLAFALAGRAIGLRVAAARRHTRALRTAAGVIMIVVAVLIGLNLTDPLQRAVPGYTAALQHGVEGSPEATGRLRDLAGGTDPARPADPTCQEGGDSLVNCGTAPELTGINGWLGTPGNAPLSLRELRGKVVLVDFWTYSCINCQRTLPHTEAWYQRYRDAGFVVIGVHTPEFAFEHDPANIAAQSRALGVTYPVAIDNDYATWNAYHNSYWPAEYLVDRNGTLRHVSFGEGEYPTTEELIRQLLSESPAAGPDRPGGGALPPPSEVPDTTPTTAQTSETYLGYHYAPLHVSGTTPTPDRSAGYRYPAALAEDTFALAGTWTSGPEALTAGPDARLELNCQARQVYLVLGGRGVVTARVGGGAPSTIVVDGVPRLYPVAAARPDVPSVVDLAVSPGVQAYDFTFG